MVWAFIAVCTVAALMDVYDRHRRRARRPAGDMLRRRADERADAWSTQHSGYMIPQHALHKHRDALDRPGARR